MEQVLKKKNVLQLTQYELDNLNSFATIKEIVFVIKDHLKRKDISRPDSPTRELS